MTDKTKTICPLIFDLGGHTNNKDSIAHKKYHTSESHDPGNKF